MALITSAQRGDVTLVVVKGTLSADDMGQLEHACSAALIDRDARLEIDLRGVISADRTAAAILRRMVVRGAMLVLPSALDDLPP